MLKSLGSYNERYNEGPVYVRNSGPFGIAERNLNSQVKSQSGKLLENVKELIKQNNRAAD